MILQASKLVVVLDGRQLSICFVQLEVELVLVLDEDPAVLFLHALVLEVIDLILQSLHLLVIFEKGLLQLLQLLLLLHCESAGAEIIAFGSGTLGASRSGHLV